MSTRCKHKKYRPSVKMENFHISSLNYNEVVAILTVTCAECGEPFLFKAQEGFSTREPTASPGRAVLYAPIVYPLDKPSKDEDKIN